MRAPGGGAREGEESVPTSDRNILPANGHSQEDGECGEGGGLGWKRCGSFEKWGDIRGGNGTPRPEMS